MSAPRTFLARRYDFSIWVETMSSEPETLPDSSPALTIDTKRRENTFGHLFNDSDSVLPLLTSASSSESKFLNGLLFDCLLMTERARVRGRPALIIRPRFLAKVIFWCVLMLLKMLSQKSNTD